MSKTCVCGNDMVKAEWKHQWVCHRCGRTEPIGIKQTNADRIRAKSDEELAEFIKNLRFKNGDCPNDTKCKMRNCYDCWLDWLKQEITEKGDE